MHSIDKEIYIVLSQTNSIMSILLKLITGKEYNHVSVSLKKDLCELYSFSRLYTYFPFPGGFTVESPNFGTLKRFKNTKVLVLALDIDLEKYDNISICINQMFANRKIYRYNYLGVLFAWFKKVLKVNNRYYCSEFVAELLKKNNIEGFDRMPEIVHPMHFTQLPNAKIIYEGSLKDYSIPKTTV